MALKNRETKWFLGVLIVPILILIAMTLQPMSVLLFGEEIVIKTAPLDPRDLFYGDHVNLRYELESVPRDKFDAEMVGQKDIKSNTRVYVELVNQNGIYEVSHVSAKRPDAGLYLNGTVSYLDDNQIIHLDYHINTFYVEENTGHELEEKAQEGNLLATMKVWKGKGILTRLASE